MATKAQVRASDKYDKEHTRSVLLKLNLVNDADILERLDAAGNKQGYIKELVRKDIRGDEEVLSLEAIRYLVIPVAKKYGIEKIYVFGSYSRGEQTAGSDVDLMIVGGNYVTYAEFANLEEAFRAVLQKAVDVVNYSKVSADQTRAGRRLREHIERDKVLVYERVE